MTDSSSEKNTDLILDSTTSYSKYFRMFVFSAPLTNLRSYTQGIKRIFEELEKTYKINNTLVNYLWQMNTRKILIVKKRNY